MGYSLDDILVLVDDHCNHHYHITDSSALELF